MKGWASDFYCQPILIMNTYESTVKASGNYVTVRLLANGTQQAIWQLEALYGKQNIVHLPRRIDQIKYCMRIQEITNTADKAKLDALKRNKDNASTALNAEKNRQKISNAQKQIRTAQ